MFKEDRKIEIEYLKNKINNNEDMLLNGDIGVGKTQLVKEAVKSSKQKWIYKEIDIAKISENEYLNMDLKKHVGFWGYINILYKIFFRKIIFFLPIITIYYSIICAVYSAKIIEPHYEWLYWGAPAYLLCILYLLIAILKIFYWGIISKKMVINVSELNFVKDEKKIRGIIWGIKDIFGKNVLYIFESTENIEGHIQSKLKLNRMKISNTNGIYKLINMKLKEIQSFKQNANPGYKKNIHHFESEFEKNTIEIAELCYSFSYRNLMTAFNDFISYFSALEGEIELIDFLSIKYFNNNNHKIFKHINKNYDIIWNFDVESQKNNFERSNFENIKTELINMCSNNSEKTFLISFLPQKSIQSLSIPKHIKKYSYFNPKFKLAYLGNIHYAYLESILVTKFLENPITFFEYIFKNNINIRDFNFKVISDNEAISFLEKFEKLNLDNFIKLETGFTEKGPLDLINYLLFNSRRNPLEYINKLSNTGKISIIYEIDKQFPAEEFEKISNINNYVLNDIPLNTRVYSRFKNFSNKEYTIFNSEDYIRKLLKNSRYNMVRKLFFRFSTSFGFSKGSKTKDVKFYDICNKEYNEEFIREIVNAIRKHDKELWIFNGEKVISKGNSKENPKENPINNI